MKPKTVFAIFSLFLLSFVFSFAQTPKSFNYQALIRDGSGNILQNQMVGIRLSILQGSETGASVYVETHQPVTTAQGLLMLQIGNGIVVSGDFSSIDWSAGPYYLKVEADPAGGTNYASMGVNELLSVPYALRADKVDNLKKLSIKGTDILSDSALFEVKRKDGQTVFAVYNDGVRVYVDENAGTKRSKGGFAVGGFNSSKGPLYTHDYFVVSPDSVRIYLNDTASAKRSKGGFAVGAFGSGKGPGQEYLRVTQDSTRVYINSTPVKRSKGGFAVSGFGKGKGTINKFMDLTPENYFIGHESGKANVSGLYNSFLGYQTGIMNISGSNNALFGFQTGYNNITGSNNLFLGYQSGFSNTDGSFNSFMGYQSGYSNTTGASNSFVGSYAGRNNTTGNDNTFSGYNSGYSNVDGNSNNFYGTGSGYSNTSGTNNIFIGPQSGYFNKTGNYNTFVGYRAGYNNTANNNVFIGNECGLSNTSGNVNVFIGYAAGHDNIDGSGNVFIGNGSGLNNTAGESNVFMGERAGYSNDDGNDNVFIGYLAGFNGYSAFANVAIGYQSGKGLTQAYNNVFVGSNTGMSTTWGESNVFIGTDAGMSNVTGGSNVIIGQGAGQKADANSNVFVGYAAGYVTTGNGNLFAGNQAGYNNTAGANNVFLGNGAGYVNATGSKNVFIGNQAGWSEGGSNKLYIDNSNTTAPLIYGDFGTNSLRFNGRVGVSVTPSYNLDVNGTVNIRRSSAPAFYIDGKEALWSNGTYFSWGFGNTYNYFAKSIIIGNSGNPGSYKLWVQGNAYSTGSWLGSDARYKTNIQTLDNSLSRLMKIRGCSYEFNTVEMPDKNFSQGERFGFIAQEIKDIFPEVVRQDKNGMYAVNYDGFIPVLVEAVKEQEKQISELKALVKELNQRLSLLENGSE